MPVLTVRCIWRTQQSKWGARNSPTGASQHVDCMRNVRTTRGAVTTPTRLCPHRAVYSATQTTVTAQWCRHIVTQDLPSRQRNRGESTEAGVSRPQLLVHVCSSECMVIVQLRQNNKQTIRAPLACTPAGARIETVSGMFSHQQHVGSPILSLNRSAPPLLSPSMFSAMAPRLNVSF